MPRRELRICLVLVGSCLAAASARGEGTAGQLPKTAVAPVVRAHLETIKSCYAGEVKKRPGLAGEIDVAWTIEKDGRVSDARVTQTTVSCKPLEDCIVAEVASWRFPAATARTAVDRFPFIFKNGAPPPPPASAPKP